MKDLSHYFLSFLMLIVILFPEESRARERKVSCGEMLEGEYIESRECHEYVLEMAPRSLIRVWAVPVGDFLQFRMWIKDQNNMEIYNSGYYETHQNLRAQTKALSSRGLYYIHLCNHRGGRDGYAGIYTIQIGCILPDGTEVEPGQGIVPKPAHRPGPDGGSDSVPSPTPSNLEAGESNIDLPRHSEPARGKGLEDVLKNEALQALADLASQELREIFTGGSREEPPLYPPPFPSPPGGPLEDSSTVGVVLFVDKDFQGRWEPFVNDDPDLSDNPIGNDAATSLRVAPGCRATLYEHVGFTGRSMVVGNDILNLKRSPVGNDNVSSIRVSCP